SQTFPPAARFNPEPSLSGKIVIVTGGQWRFSLYELLKHNAKVYIAGRSKVKYEECIPRLRRETDGRDVLFLELDLGNLGSIKRAAEGFLSKEHELNILFNHAGQMLPPAENITVDEYDAQLGTNVLGHWNFYLTKQLLPALKVIAGAKCLSDGKARVVNASSIAHYFGSLDFGTFRTV
ncbi:hypothetical protein B0H17DRAFT_940429, partial [Mycena rosella]